MGVPEKNKLESAIEWAGAQWRDEDLDDILALLDKDYTKPQEDPLWVLPEQKSTISVLPQQLKLEDEEIVPPLSAAALPAFATKAEEEELKRLLGMDTPPAIDLTEGAQAPAVPLESGLREEFIPQAPYRAGTGEQPDYSDAPEKPQREGLSLPLKILAAVEAAALVLVVIWWLQWMG